MPYPPLHRNQDFTAFWLGQTVSTAFIVVCDETVVVAQHASIEDLDGAMNPDEGAGAGIACVETDGSVPASPLRITQSDVVAAFDQRPIVRDLLRRPVTHILPVPLSPGALTLAPLFRQNSADGFGDRWRRVALALQVGSDFIGHADAELDPHTYVLPGVQRRE